MNIKSVAAVELDDNHIKVLHLRLDKSAAVSLAAGTVEVSIANEELAAEKLRRLLDTLRISAPWAIACISRRHITMRTLSLPATDPKELHNMVGFQVLKQVPFSKDEIVLDYTVLGKTAEGYSKVLLAIAQKKIIAQALSLLEKAGLAPLSLRLSTQEAAFFYARHFPGKKQKGPALFVDFDKDCVEFVAVDGNGHLFSRSVAAGIDRLPTEMENTLSLYKKEEPDLPLGQIVLVDAPAQAKTLLAPRAEEWKLPLEEWRPKENFIAPIKKHSSFQIPPEKISFSPLFGMAENPVSPNLNLLPEKIERGRKSGQLEQEVGRLGIVAIAALLLLSLFFYLKNLGLDSRTASLENQIASNRPQAQQLETMKKKIELVEAQGERENFSIDVLAEIYRLIPNEISLDSFAYDAATGVVLKGTAANLSDVFEWIPKLEASPYFEKVASKGTTTKKIKDRVYTDFHLDMPFARGNREPS